MNRHLDLVIGALIAIMFSTMLLVVFPYAQLADLKPPKGLKPYTEAQLRGRNSFHGIRNAASVRCFFRSSPPRQ